MKRFESGLTSEGVSFHEMVKLLQLYKNKNDFNKVRQIVFSENYLGKRSDSRINNILTAFKKRFLNTNNLPSLEFLSLAIVSNLPEEAKKQILFPYYLFSDELLKTAYNELVIKNMGKGERLIIYNSDVVDFLRKLGKDHENVEKWSQYLKKKWATRFLTFLRTFGVLERYPDNKLKKIYVFPETFAFFVLWFSDNGLSFNKIKSDELWKFYLLKQTEIFELVNYGYRKDWWYFNSAGKIISFQAKYNLKEWLIHGLE